MTEDSFWADPVLLAVENEWADEEIEFEFTLEDLNDTPPKSENSR